MNKLACGVASMVYLFVCAIETASHAADPKEAKHLSYKIKLEGMLKGKEQHLNVSGLAFSDDRELLVVTPDEGATIQVLKKANGNTYGAAPERDIRLSSKGDEIDFEGVAWGNEYVYVIGSHSRKRRRIKYREPDPQDNKSAKNNRKRLRTTAIEPPRERLYRLKLDRRGRVVEESIDVVSLRNLFANDKVLRPFQALPSKENGIDIEGIAADGDKKLFIGFRGPVLRGNFVPVLVMAFEDEFKEGDLKYDILFVNLGGRGIRDMIRLQDDEFLILAGPMGDGPGSYRLYRWNGQDCVPGKDKIDALKNVKALCDLPEMPEGAKAEGLAVMGRPNGEYEFLILFDGIANGGATVYRCKR